VETRDLSGSAARISGKDRTRAQEDQMRRPTLVLPAVLALAALAAAPASSRADGLPTAGVDVGASGIAEPGGLFRYVTLAAGKQTIVARVGQRGGQVTFFRRLRGRFTIPAVAYDGSASGLSADGQTLVLIRPRARFPQRETVLAVIDTPRLRSRTVKLRGDFSFDAISPDGRYVYLIHYLSPPDQTSYEVRAYDLRRSTLLGAPIGDPSEPGEQMRGIPASRATSPDGRWAYTLYEVPQGAPFVHALDTARRTAVCIDLRDLEGRNLAPMGLAIDPAAEQLTVTTRGRPVALIDTETFAVSDPAPRADPGSEDAGASFPWFLLGALAVGALAAALLTAGRRGRRSAGELPTDPWMPGDSREEHEQAEREHSGVR
jgi:hypothetical protein